MIKDSKESINTLIATKTMRECTRGRRMSLHKQFKRIATTFPTKEARRHYIRMMIDAVVTEREMANRKKGAKSPDAIGVGADA